MAPGRIINAGFVSHSVVLVLVCLWVACDRANGITFDLPPGKVECFYEDVHQGTVINGAFAVLQGGSHMDIDVSIFNPEDHQVYNVKREGEDKFQLKADHDGTYRFCFGNTMSMMAHKTVSLVLNAGDPIDLSQLAKKESMDNVERWIISISHTVRMIDFHQQEYRMLHDRHMRTITATNRRVKWWSFLECLAVVAVSTTQVLFIKRMFNKNTPGLKRMV